MGFTFFFFLYISIQKYQHFVNQGKKRGGWLTKPIKLDRLKYTSIVLACSDDDTHQNYMCACVRIHVGGYVVCVCTFFVVSHICVKNENKCFLGFRAGARHVYGRTKPSVLHPEGAPEEQLQGDGGARQTHEAGTETSACQGTVLLILYALYTPLLFYLYETLCYQRGDTNVQQSSVPSC